MEQETQEAKKVALSTPAAILVAGIIIALAVVFTNNPKQGIAVKNTNEAAANTQETVIETPKLSVRDTDHINGDITKAQVAIIEYSDSDCPFCERFHTTMQQVRSEYGDKVAWVYRYYPLISLHPNAQREAIALECAATLGGNDAFWNYMDKAITTKFETTDKAGLENLAVQVGLDKALFAQCVQNGAAANVVGANTQEAESIGAKGTPFSVAVNIKTGKQVTIPGAYPIEEVRKFIDSLL